MKPKTKFKKKVRITLDKWISKVLYTPKRVTRNLLSGNAQETDQLCIFAHYDPRCIVDPHVFYHLEKLVDAGFCIYFVTASKRIRENDLKKLQGLCLKIIFKKDKGRDFGSYYIGFSHIENINAYNRILISNDSVYGPLKSIQKMFDKMEDSGFDIWGITDSFDQEYHIQSYFVVFEKAAIQSNFFKYFWSQFYFTEIKKVIIRQGEIALSRIAKRCGLKLGALCPVHDVIKKTMQGFLTSSLLSVVYQSGMMKNTSVPAIDASNFNCFTEELRGQAPGYLDFIALGESNPTHYSWHVLLKDYGCPYIKIELLKINPSRIKNLPFVWDMIEDQNTKNLIIDHLKHYQPKKLLD